MSDVVSREWKEGWPLVVASMAGMSVISILMYASGLIMGPLEREFGWSRTQISAGLLINSVIGVTCAPFVGKLIDRLGPRRIGVPGLIVFCGSFAALATVSGNVWHWRAVWLAIAVGALMCKPTVWTAAVASRFDKHRGAALAATLSATGLTGIFAPALGGLILEAHGWRMTLIGLALIWFLVAFPLCGLFFYGAIDLRRKAFPLADRQPAQISAHGPSGLLTWKYFRLGLSVFMLITVISSTIVHLVPFFIGAGISPVAAASMASAAGGATIIGRLATGVLLDRYDSRLIGGVCFLLPAILMMGLLNFDGSVFMAISLAVLLGLSSGAEVDIAAYMTSRHFGVRNYGLLFGIIVGLMSLALGVGPMILSAVYDHFGSYRVAFIGAIPISIVASALIASLGPNDPRFAVGQAH